MHKLDEGIELIDSPSRISSEEIATTSELADAKNHAEDVQLRKSKNRKKPEIWLQNENTRNYIFKLFTCFYALFIVVGGIVVELSNLISNGSKIIHTGKDLVLGIWLFGGSILFIGYCAYLVYIHYLNVLHKRKEYRLSLQYKTGREPDVLTNSSTGSLYLRIGCVIFGLIGVVYYSLLCIICLLGWNQSQEHEGECTVSSNSLNLISAVFIFAQMWFVYCNGKIIFTGKGNIARIGLMHLVGTNLWMWLRYIIYEEVETIHEINRFEKLTNHQSHKNGTIHEHEICKGVLCIFEGYSEFMYTCVVEYSLLCAGVAFVFWTNIESAREETLEKQMRKRSRLTIDCSRTAEGLFIGKIVDLMKFQTKMPGFIFIIFTILAVALYNAFSGYEAVVGHWIFSCTNLAFFILATLTCLLAFWRMKILKFKHGEMEDEDASAELLDRILLVVGLIGELLYGMAAILSFINNPSKGLPLIIFITNIVRLFQVTFQSGLIIVSSRLEIDPEDDDMRRYKPGKQLITLLLMINVSQFFLNVFEAQKAGINDEMLRMYGSYYWAFVVRGCSPLTIFYRRSKRELFNVIGNPVTVHEFGVSHVDHGNTVSLVRDELVPSRTAVEGVREASTGNICLLLLKILVPENKSIKDHH
ncbi:hypothetical protein WR25_05139 [Diploscapter pachys]|uniref:Uncharacterized protein n=1 Tax=Diploscapter pachys TaxID=2018661 RepID=A0A2A2JI04_9BILA|nr:hypothetical protein WR25_05139 [Diploscapter pachys]